MDTKGGYRGDLNGKEIQKEGDIYIYIYIYIAETNTTL